MSFTTPLTLAGPLRRPLQMLDEQTYGGHTSIHDDEMAGKLGFQGAPIEGPTHFSQFQPLLAQIWGQAWFETGCISAHFQNMVIEGEEVQAFAEIPAAGATETRVWATKADGTPVLEASASIGNTGRPTLLDNRMAQLRPYDRLLILEDLHVGMRGAAEVVVRIDADQYIGPLYPFSLRQKLEKITENSPWFSDASASPWGRPILPFEMLSVLFQYTEDQAGFPVKGPVVGLFADQEIRLIEGPLFVGEDYLLRHEIVALAESRRTESYWVRSQMFDKSGERQVAEMLLNHAVLKDSYAGYAGAQGL